MSTKLVLGIDHGYKNIKSEHFCFPTAISELKSLPDDKSGVLEYGGKIYTENGEQIKFVNSSIKSDTEEFYLLVSYVRILLFPFQLPHIQKLFHFH